MFYVIVPHCLFMFSPVAMERVGDEGSDGDDEGDHTHFHHRNEDFDFAHDVFSR